MCFFGGGAKAAPAPKKAEFEDAPPVVTGKQTGVDDPKDTKKATDKLKMDRKKKEGTYVEPTSDTNLERTTSLLTKSGGGNKTAQQKANLAANRKKAKSLALKRKSNTRPKGAYGGASDIRLKENISEVGLSKLGYKIYEFNYKNDDTRYRGAMAQDVITKLPKAISLQDGYLYVNYDMIDINMEAI